MHILCQMSDLFSLPKHSGCIPVFEKIFTIIMVNFKTFLNISSELKAKLLATILDN